MRCIRFYDDKRVVLSRVIKLGFVTITKLLHKFSFYIIIIIIIVINIL